MMQVSQNRAGRRYSSESLPRGGVVGGMVGSGTESSGTSSCLATSARASAKRPLAASQRIDSGHQRQISKPTTAGAMPSIATPRQPIGSINAAEAAEARNPPAEAN